MGSVERSMEHPVKRSQAMSETVDNTSGMDTNMGIKLSKGGITGNKNPMVSKILGTVIRDVKAESVIWHATMETILVGNPVIMIG